MFSIDFLTKENIAIIGISILFIWRVIDFFVRLGKRRKHELERLAFDMAKIKSEDDKLYRGSIISYYYFCLDALRKKMTTSLSLFDWFKKKEDEINTTLIQIRGEVERFERVKADVKRTKEIKYEDLYEKSVTWHSLYRDFKILIKKLFSLKKKNK